MISLAAKVIELINSFSRRYNSVVVVYDEPFLPLFWSLPTWTISSRRRTLHHTFNNFHDLNQFLVHHRLAHNLHMGRQTLAHIRFICKLVSSSRHHTAQLKHPEKLTRRFILVSLLHKPPILLSICLPNP
jgi:hypothetical protein